LQVGLLAEQSQSEALGPAVGIVGVSLGVALLATLLGVLAALVITRGIATPLAALAETATRIAEGDLDRTAPVTRADETGTLARAFNNMTQQLRELVSGLEQRVADRTRDLEQRSAYLEAAAEVGRAATSILETDALIQQVVELIRSSFGLYYVGLFLVDELGEWAVLQAGTGVAGQAMLARHHRIRVGEGMIGWCIAHEQARIALYAEQDAIRLLATELPNTRSEAALPLRSRGQVLGALTVQSEQANAFDQDTLIVLETMADQVAVALDNARLLAESQEALDLSRRAYGELSRQAWVRRLRERAGLGYRSREQGITPAPQEWSPEVEQAWRTGQIIQRQAQATWPLAIPIQVRDQVIGVLSTHKSGPWTAEEIALVQAVIDQLGAALESSRLFEETQRRAQDEQQLRAITAQVRDAPSLDAILQTAAQEIARALGVERAFVQLGTPPPLEPGRET
ncbi:MAG: GAF domain-containing protein, partial [Chloroflexi bacterium]|nr:GAF domain-containing protein [Chloroflexota bacterium]